MKGIFLIVTLILSVHSFSQEWTSSELEIIEKFKLSTDDHRGIRFTSNQETTLVFATLKDALTYYLKKENLVDIIDVSVEEYPAEYKLEGGILGMKEVVEIYIDLNQ